MRRTQERRRRGTNYTGILRNDRTRPPETTPQVTSRGPNFSWRWVSLVIVICLSAILALFFVTDVFYVRSVAVGGLQYMTKEEVFAYADIANWHIFWVEPESVRKNLTQFPTVADADVRIGWPPNMVNITIEEREPALIWEQAGTAIWVDINGKVMAQRAERLDLVRVTADTTFAGDPLDSGALPLDVVYGALQLQELRPEIAVWRYDPSRGLGFRNNNGWDVWFGVGTDMPEKLKIFNAIAADIQAKGIPAAEINVADPDAPYYTQLF